jgi:hypothetical protein
LVFFAAKRSAAASKSLRSGTAVMAKLPRSPR